MEGKSKTNKDRNRVLCKVKDLKMPTTKRERNFLKGMNMMDTHVWFRYRYKTTGQQIIYV